MDGVTKSKASILTGIVFSVLILGLGSFSQNAYAGNGFGASENSQFLGGTGIDVFTDIPCDGFDPQDLQTGCFDYVIDNTEIFYDPNAGAWHKHLQDPNNDCQSPICTITETVTIASGGLDWTDWHEVLFEPVGATWIDAKVTINPGEGETVLTDSGDNIVIDTTFTTDDTVWIFFDEPLPVGTVLFIEKTWELSGDTPTPFDGHPLGEVTILQFPSIDFDVVLIDENSEIIIDPFAVDGFSAFEWEVDGIFHLFDQIFFVDFPASLGNVPFGFLDIDAVVVEDTDTDGDDDKVTITYGDSGGQFEIDLMFKLIGGEDGSNSAELEETIVIRNVAEGVMNFDIFEFSDFDISDSDQGDIVEIIPPDFATQTDPSETSPQIVSETTVNPDPSHFRAGLLGDVEDDVASGQLDDIAGPVGPDDVAWAFQWTFDLVGGEEFVITKVKEISPAETSPPASFRLIAHDNNNNSIIQINIETGEAEVLKKTGFKSQASGLETSRETVTTAIGDFPPGTHFGILRDLGNGVIGDDDDSEWIVQIDIDGTTTKVVEITDGLGGRGVGFGFDGSTFYATDNEEGTLYIIDMVTGDKELVGSFDSALFSRVDNLQWDPVSETFISLVIQEPVKVEANAQVGPPFEIVASIDPDTAEISLVSVLSEKITPCTIARNPFTGIWYSANRMTGEFVKIDIDTGSVTIIGKFDPDDTGKISNQICGMAFEEPVEPSPKKTSGAGGHEPPTIGKALDGVRQVVDGGMAIDGQTWTVTQPYHQEFELLQMLSSPHTISNVIHCDKGVQYCNYIAVGFMGLTDDFNNPVMTVSASKNHLGDWTIDWYDPDDYISDPSDAAPADIIFVPQIIDNRLLGTSFTIDFKNKDTGQLKMGIQVRDSYNGVRNFFFNEGVEFIDADAYPQVESAYDAPVEVESLCFGQNNPDRNSCQFAKMKDWATQNAEETLRQMMGNQYEYEQ